MLDRRKRARARPAIMTRDNNMVGLGFGHASRNGPDANLRDQLDRNRCPRVGVLQVVDELSKVLNRVNVMVWRRADETDAGH